MAQAFDPPGMKKTLWVLMEKVIGKNIYFILDSLEPGSATAILRIKLTHDKRQN